MTNSFALGSPIYSSLAADPLMGELVDMYVDEMPGRIGALEEALASDDRDQLRRAAHQMKGAAGSYGFDGITESAAVLEAAVRDACPPEVIQRRFDELVGLCRRIRAGTSPV